MFYTLGDYRDIVVRGGHKDGSGKEIVVHTSDDKDAMQKIQEKIDTILKQSGDTPAHKPSDEQRKTLWDRIAEHVWNGMICALTHKTETPGHVDEDVKGQLFENGKNTLKSNYQYTSVTIGASGTEAKTNPPKTPSPSGEKTTLVDFISRPPYFRYLEEWGQNFCKERKKRLEEVEKECVKNGQKCSGYGENCEDQLKDDPSNFPDLKCPSCATPCGLYKKWINTKKTQYEKQSNAYEQQKENYVNGRTGAAPNNGGDNGFCVTVTTCDTAAKFLERLASCSKNNNTEEDKIEFDKPHVTFRPATYCDPCSEFNVKCENRSCRGDGTKVKCNGSNRTTTITASDIKNGGDSTEINMLVSDDSKSGSGFEGNGLEACTDAHIFEGFRKDEWKCDKVCGYVVCKPENGNGEIGNGKPNGENPIITITALVTHWVQNFLEDYNKINDKISHCTNTVEGSKCINGCQNKCNCIEQWINKKRTEWTNIKNRFNEQYNGDDTEMKSLVKNFFEELIPKIAATIDKGNHNGLVKLVKSVKCNCGNNSQNGKEGEENDLVKCLLNKLEEKAKKCKEDHSSVEPCPQTTSENPDDEDEQLEEETEVNMPTICKDVIKETAEEQTDDKCGGTEEKKDEKKEESEAPGDPAGSSTDQESEKKPNPEQVPESQENQGPPAQPQRPRPQPPSPVHPTLSDEPSKPISDILSSTIPFGIAIALTSIVFLFLKKKTKLPVDLFSVINIPKSDYDIPTKLSPNRYIPYTSGKYRGKRYIYLEGDSGTDSGYTDHYSDITSSSESEYEELDINDIYVPHAPKYKTLIEVVLEPSGNNTTASGNNTPSDTQNDIQNDGIPSDIPNSDTPPPITDDEWNKLKHDFISNMLQNQPNTEPNILRDNVDNNTHPTPSRHTLDQKPFITSIHDRDLYSGEEYNYNVNMVNSMDDIPINRDNNVYSGIDLINDTLSGNAHIDIYDEVLKRKENELFGTNHVKQTSIHSVAKLTNSAPIHNQLELFHKWLDRHRDMCEQWENHHERLAKLKEEWENETHSGNKHSDIPSGKLSDTPSDNNIHSDIHPSDIPSVTYHTC
ncbi:hypothetical protein PFFCH_03768 [Plasmodium falciparum FCH/4]|uniref:Uncharacterized protein n=1 Tax=Plasmodium falciparum FCH/4 TaxID=1036724 RepID=A0A024VKR7_PLAFA|nr:hypothetical protein PFFCH_03768 [Plasmodium falciparum FCH/4]